MFLREDNTRGKITIYNTYYSSDEDSKCAISHGPDIIHLFFDNIHWCIGDTIQIKPNMIDNKIRSCILSVIKVAMYIKIDKNIVGDTYVPRYRMKWENVDVQETKTHIGNDTKIKFSLK